MNVSMKTNCPVLERYLIQNFYFDATGNLTKIGVDIFLGRLMVKDVVFVAFPLLRPALLPFLLFLLPFPFLVAVVGISLLVTVDCFYSHDSTAARVNGLGFDEENDENFAVL